jgi:crotonobetainyl-CoA:carnitine CoA-transferase CaiB-like acyl-CoA transferase
MDAPLHGLRVVELASVLAGPSVGMFLAELGAEVVKVENPRTRGDVTRRWSLPEEDPANDCPAYFCAANWGKRSVGLDLAHPDGLAVALRLIGRADVLVSSFRPGQAAALGVDAPALRAQHPRLVVAEIDGYGADDARAGYDAVIQAESGFMHLNGDPDGAPTKMPVALMDLLAAHQLKEGILLALLGRERSGEGAHVRVSLLDAGVTSLANQAAAWLTAGVAPRPLGSAHPTIAPYGTPYETATGSVVLAVGTDRQFASLCDALGLGLAADPRFATNAARVRHREALDAALVPALRAADRAALLSDLRARGVPAGAVRDLPTLFADPASAALVLRAPEGPAAVRTVAFTGDASARRDLRAPPRYAADTAAVLAETLDLDAEAIARLARAGAIETPAQEPAVARHHDAPTRVEAAHPPPDSP